jgi:hypothetical protein
MLIRSIIFLVGGREVGVRGGLLMILGEARAAVVVVVGEEKEE